MRRRTVLAGITAATASRWSPAAAQRPAPTQGAVAFRVQARARCARPPITLGHGFARGEVPRGSRLALQSSSGARIPVQSDQQNRWPDGSLRFAALSFAAPETYAAGQTLTYRLAAEPGDPGREGAVTRSQLAAATDFRLRVSGDSFGQDTFAVSVNDVLATLPAWTAERGWGSNPIGGWEVVREGPVCTEWRVWRMLRRDSDGASHRWVKAVLYVRAWADGSGGIAACEVLPSLRQSNSYGPHPAGTAGAAGPQPAHVGVAELWNGGTRLYAWGGPNDPRTGTIPASAFDVANGVLGQAAGPWHTATGRGIMLSGPGVPSAVPQNRVLWLSATYGLGTALCPTRGDAFQISDNRQAWQPGHNYGSGDVVAASGGQWICVNGGGTSGTGKGPSGPGPFFMDGPIKWYLMHLAFGRPGTGQARVVPVIATFPGSNVVLATAGGDPVWVGTGNAAARPELQVAHDAAYLTRRARLLPTYNLALKVEPDSHRPYPYQPNEPSIYGDQTGDNAGDERIGYLSDSQVHLLLCPFDPAREATCKSMAFNFFDFPGFWEDERTGRSVARTSRSYPGLIPNPEFALGDWNGSRGRPPWQGLGASPNMYQGRYRPLMDGSHLPALWIMPYLRTGHAAYAELGLAEAMTTLASQYQDARDPKVGNKVYQNCVLAPNAQQVRGIGWSLRALGMLDALMPDADALRAFIRDTMDDNAAFAAAWPATIDPRAARLGALWEIGTDYPWLPPWMYAIVGLCVAAEAWRGDRVAGWMTLLKAMAPATIGYWDEAQGGSGYYADSYHLDWSSNGKGDPAAAYPSIAAMLRSTHQKAPPRPTGVYVDAGGGAPLDDAGLVGRGIFQGESVFPYTANSYYAMTLASLAMQAAVSVPRAAETYAAVQRRVSSPPLRGIAFTGRDRGTGAPLAYPTWAIVPP